MSEPKYAFGVVLVAIIKVKEGKLEQLIQLMSKIRKNAEENETDTLSYRPMLSDDKKTIYVFEKYSTVEALDYHRNSQEYHALLKVEDEVTDGIQTILGEEFAAAS